MNFKSMGVGMLVMLAITVIWTAVDVGRAWLSPAAFYIDPTDTERVDLGRRLYAAHCAACHGQKLEGQPNWRIRRANGRLPAPRHDESGHTWHHPDAVLFDITRHGMVPGRTAPADYASDMPAYEQILTDEEIIAVLAYIKSTWPEDIQQLQREVNQNAEQGGAR